MVSLLAPNVLFYPMRKSTARTRGYIYSIHIPSGVCSTPPNTPPPVVPHLTPYPVAANGARPHSYYTSPQGPTVYIRSIRNASVCTVGSPLVVYVWR